MDPDAALDELLCLVEHMRRLTQDDCANRIDSVDILRAGELVEALDSWLTVGGFLPQRWQPASRRTA